MSEEPLDRLVDELRSWARRPGRISPGAARTRVLAGLDKPRRHPAWRLVVGGAALAAAALVLVLVVGRRPEPAASPGATLAAATAGVEPPAQRTIVHQLSSGTQLYVVLRPDAFQDEH